MRVQSLQSLRWSPGSEAVVIEMCLVAWRGEDGEGSHPDLRSLGDIWRLIRRQGEPPTRLHGLPFDTRGLEREVR